jgi:hypothetical protein
VNVPVRVDIYQCAKYGEGDHRQLVFGELVVRIELILQRAPAHVLHHDALPVRRGVGERVEEANDEATATNVVRNSGRGGLHGED